MRKIFKGCAVVIAAFFASACVAAVIQVATGVDTTANSTTKSAPAASAKDEADSTGKYEKLSKYDSEERAERYAKEQAKREAEEQAKKEAEEKAKREAEEQAKREAEEQAKREAEEQAKREAEEQAKREAEEQARAEAEAAASAGSSDFDIQGGDNYEDRAYGHAGQTVYVTPNGHSYHSRKGCPTLSRSKNILEMTIENAVSEGRDPCDVCC